MDTTDSKKRRIWQLSHIEIIAINALIELQRIAYHKKDKYLTSSTKQLDKDNI